MPTLPTFFVTLIISFVLLRSLLERKESQKEEEMLQQIQVTLKEGKAKIEKGFSELTKKFNAGLEKEKRLVEDQYVSLLQLMGEINV